MRARLLAPILLLLSGCGQEGEVLPTAPQLRVDRQAVTFGGEFGEAVYVGTAPQESLLLENRGQGELVLEEVVQEGDGAFSVEGPTVTRLASRERAFLRVIFTPTAEREYTGTLLVRSNAENAPALSITLSGTGVKP